MIGQVVSHYKILEKLGEGGMGVVYRAEDLKLKRVVALKFLPHHVKGTEAEQARFLQEAQAAASLNHPNICTIHGIEEWEGKQFIEMELIEGATLRRKTPVGKIDDAIAYALQIGEALREAHTKGIVHRDIKADNIMVNAHNQVKVMDFGLAKLKGSLKLTRTSSTVGTLAYMAPEQIQGGEADARSDIFSFGVVLFEMLTGKMPFRGEHEAAMMYSILNEEPEPLTKYLPEAEPELARIIQKALDKDPETRYQSVTDMIVDLRRLKKDSTRVRYSGVVAATAAGESGEAPAPRQRAHAARNNRRRLIVSAVLALVAVAAALLFLVKPWKSSGAKGGEKTLAVLPFEDQGEPGKAYFADGITDEISSKLSRLSGLGVIARSSARQYKNTTKPLKQIGEELGVQYVLMGTIRWSGNGAGEQRVHVNPELVNVSNSIQVWSQPFEVTLSEASTIQADIASEVARALDVSLLQPERQSLVAKPTENAQAYDYYLQGLQYDNRGYLRGDLELAAQMYQQAINADPRFAAAYAKLSIDYASMYWFFYDRSDERIRAAGEAADKALALDPTLADAYAAKGWYYYHGMLDYDNALAQFAIALQYQPNNVNVHSGIGAVRRRQGKMREAIASFRKAVAVDPLSIEVQRQLGETLVLVRDYQEAENVLNHVLMLSPDNLSTYVNRIENMLNWTGDAEKARAVLDQASAQHVRTNDPELLWARYRTEMFGGDYTRVMKLLHESFAGKGVDNQFSYAPAELLEANAERLLGDPAKARPHYEAARVTLENLVALKPADERYRSALGLAYAGLGRKEDAIREALRGVELLPVEREAWRGTFRLAALASVYTMTGDEEKAVDVLERLRSIPSDISAPALKSDPSWKSLRGNARFQSLVQQQGG